jgi:hypothetical protein
MVFLLCVRRLLVTASVFPCSQIFVNLKKGALSSSETSFLTRATLRNISEDAILRVRVTLLFVQCVATDTITANVIILIEMCVTPKTEARQLCPRFNTFRHREPPTATKHELELSAC